MNKKIEELIEETILNINKDLIKSGRYGLGSGYMEIIKSHLKTVITSAITKAVEEKQNRIIRIIKGRLLIKTIRQSIIRIIKHTDE